MGQGCWTDERLEGAGETSAAAAVQTARITGQGSSKRQKKNCTRDDETEHALHALVVRRECAIN